jgi:hypothetical protein
LKDKKMDTETKLVLERVKYSSLKGRQKENYNFQKISSVLADFGFSTVRLTDDWEGADFVAQHADGKTLLRVQLKPRLCFSKKYMGKGLWMCFRDEEDFYLFPHDLVLRLVLSAGRTMNGSESWEVKGLYSFTRLSNWMKPLLKEYLIPIQTAKAPINV